MEKKKIIIDTDPGIDDALAIILASKSDKLEILGITTTSGNTNIHQTTQNALDILHLVNKEDIPVYQGVSLPLKKEPVYAEETHGKNGLGNIQLEKTNRKANPEAVEFLYQTLKENPGTTLVALGPLTNIATLLQKYPEISKSIKEIVLMGGNFKSYGNCSPIAEFNFWFDPEAAHYVFNNFNGLITMTGLDVTRKILLTPNYIKLIKKFNNDLSRAIVDMTNFYSDFHWEQEGVLGCVINDPLVIAYLIDPSVCDGFLSHVDIITDGPTRGMSMVDEKGFLNLKKNCFVLTECNPKKFFKLFLKTLFPDKEEIIENILNNETYGI